MPIWLARSRIRSEGSTSGVRPRDAFVILITTFDNLGILLGLSAWVLLLVLAVTSFFRIRLIKRLHFKYPTWRYFHGGLAVAFVALAIWHAINLGRHTDTAIAVYFITLASIGITMLARQYWGAVQKKPTPAPNLEGAKT